MKKLFETTYAIILISFLLSFSFADTYGLTVSREDSNRYKVSGMDVYIQTNYCYEYAYFEESILDMFGRTGDITFTDSGQTCTVAGVYADAGIKSGSYSVTVTRKDSNWYEIFGKDLFIETSLCLQLAIMQDATLDISYGGKGTIYFERGQSCSVKGVFSRLSL